jgi:hypothetical protein
MAGGTRVTVSGSGFRSGSTKCQFGTLSPTSSTYISQTQIVCFSPAAGTDVSGSVALEVTADNSGSADTFSADGVLFTYQGQLAAIPVCALANLFLCQQSKEHQGWVLAFPLGTVS